MNAACQAGPIGCRCGVNRIHSYNEILADRISRLITASDQASLSLAETFLSRLLEDEGRDCPELISLQWDLTYAKGSV